jgi:hypothetical protein
MQGGQNARQCQNVVVSENLPCSLLADGNAPEHFAKL